MKTVIYDTAAVFLVLLLFLSASCSAEKAPVYNSDIPVAQLAESFDALLANGTRLSAVDDDYITGMIGLDLEDVTEYVLKIQTSGTEIDQYGVFKTSSEAKAAELSGSVESYLEMLRENWGNFNYLPAEMPKINAAEVRSAGIYVLFVIASEDEKKAVFENFYTLIEI